MQSILGSRLGLVLMLLAAIAGCNGGDPSAEGVTASLPDSHAKGSDATESPGGAEARPMRQTMHPVVRIETTLGTITAELDAERAPITVENFLWYVNNGHYRDTIFHQVVRGYVAIGGGYTADLKEKPTLIAIRNETDRSTRNQRGTLSMARRPDVIDSSTCQFFFNLADNSNLDQKSRNSGAEFGYCVFGRVTEGMDVLDRISAVPVSNKRDFASVPVTPIVIKSVTRLR